MSNLISRAEAESDDLIIKGAKGIKDGLYNIKDGKLYQYKAKGGTVRTYPIVTIDYAPTPFTIKTTSAEPNLQPTCNQLATDLISRADAIEALGEEPEIILDTDAEWEMHDRWVDAMTSMKSLPSAEPITSGYIADDKEVPPYTTTSAISAEAVQGEWYNRNSDGTWATVDFAYCSNCKQPIIHKHASPLWRFCPSCGARMTKGGDSE